MDCEQQYKQTIESCMSSVQKETFESQKGVNLVGLVNEKGSFAGYHPKEGVMPEGYKLGTSEDNVLDMVPIVVGG